MRILKHSLIALFISTSFACSGYKVQQDYNERVNFSYLKTYAWTSGIGQNTKDPVANTSLIQKRIHNAIDLNLAKKGFRRVPAKQANFLVHYHFHIIRPEQKAGVRTGVGVGHSNRGSFGGISLSFGGSKGEQSRLTIDVLNPSNKKLLWRGATVGQFSGNKTPQKNTENIYNGVSAIMKKFPPK